MAENKASACPSLEALDRFVSEGAADAAVARHLSECRKCSAELERIERNVQFLAELSGGGERPGPVVATLPGPDSIAGYEILKEIHRGGQGVVYKAMQTATRRTVALKVLRQGALATSRQRHRFEREVDLLAGLHHPNIITVYEGGMTRDGQHYFAMEYIHGKPLDAHWSDKQLTLDQSLRLFQEICIGVNYAHQRGVIHRDLKPGNICIDGNGRPHILDFGLARAAAADLTCGRPVTVTGEFMGTLSYASPEQTKGDPELIDVRSDVYSLGVILYEMLTGEHPYPVVGQMADVLRNIAEAEPRKPSTSRRQIDDEVETILLTALAKQAERRYQSAEALARDIEHYLSGEPIDAKRDSGWYVIKKTLRRYRLPVSIAAVFALLVIGFGITMTIQAGRIAAQRDRALAAERDGLAQAETARQVSQFMIDMFKVLDPSESAGNKVTVREILDQAARRAAQLDNQPEMQARIMDALGTVFRNLGLYDDAAPLLQNALATRRRMLGPDDPDMAHSLSRLAALQQVQGRYAQAESLWRQAVAALRKHPDQQEALAATLTGLSGVLVDTGDYDAAEQAVREALTIQRPLLGEAHPDLAWSLNNLAWVIQNKGDYAQAEQLYRQALAMRRKLYEGENEGVARSMDNLAGVLALQGRFADAEEMYRKSLAMRRKLFGNQHPDVATSLHYLGWALYRAGELTPAEPPIREALAIRRRTLPRRHADIGRSLLLLGRLLVDKDDAAAAEPLLRESVEILDGALSVGARHTAAAIARSVLGECLTSLGRYDDAEPLLLKSLGAIMASRRQGDPEAPEALQRIIGLYEAWNKPVEAAKFRALIEARPRPSEK